MISSAGAAGLSEAQLTRIIKEVKLLPAQASPRAAALNDSVKNGTAVRTGAESRAELTFKDLTITRLGANTIFSFNEGTRNLDLGGGAILVNVPKDAGGAKITTAAITAGITGTTVLLEVHRNNNSKAAVLEGVMLVALPNDPAEWVKLHAGQMIVVPPNAKKMPRPVTFDLKVLVESSPLITEFSPLPSAPLIAEEIALQQAGNGPAQTDEEPPMDVIDQRFNVVTGTGGGGAVSKFGPINTITTPNPYVITSGTTIQTDPKITTGGKTDLGKIYRGPPIDGSASSYFFGSSTSFDQDFDTIGETPSTSQVAGFKFSALQLAGNPTISLGSGGPSALALISVGNISTGGAGAALTFSNMNFVALATQAGSIDLGSNVAFSSVPELFLYARGAGSNLTVASPMTNMGALTLDAEGNVQVNANEDVQGLRSNSNNFLSGSGVITVHSGLSLRAVNAVNFSMARYVFDPATPADVNLDADVINVDASAGPDLFKSASTVTINGNSAINFTGATTVTFGNTTSTNWTAGSSGFQAPNTAFAHPNGGLAIFSIGSVFVKSIAGGDTIQSTGSDITTNGDLTSRVVNAFGNITVGGNLTSSQLVQAGGNVSVSGGTLTALDVEAGGDVDAAHVSVLTLNGNVTTSSTTLSAGAGGITPYLLSSSNVHNFTVATVESNTAAIGLDFSGNNFSAAASPGASLTLNTQLQVFSPVTGINNANFNGKDGPNPGDIPGDGGSLTVLDQQGITMNTNTISATTGIISAGAGQPPAGAGGNVNLTTNGPLQITTNSTIQVSSSDPAGTVNRRSSASGGNITLQSAAATGVAIQVDSSSQLLALLEAAAPGPGGKIVIRASGSSSSIQAGGTMRADGGVAANGTIDIRHSGDSGIVSVNSANLRADIIKVAALGTNGNLTIGAGNTINANTILKLYADGSNGTLNFVGPVTLTSQSIILAASTINISNGVTVTITSPAPAQVFADNRNYQGPGGTGGPGTGMFGGTGAPTALTTSGFGARPLLDPVGGP